MSKTVTMSNDNRTPLGDKADIHDFIRYATLAPNGHNTQPWKFIVNGNKVQILPDYSRRTPVVDPDDHHLFISLGCALENFVIAAHAHGQACDVLVNDKGEIDISLSSTTAQTSILYDVIPQRQSTRAVFNGKDISSDHLSLLAEAALEEGVEIKIITDANKIASVSDFVIEANNMQLRDSAFVEELTSWIRFNRKHAVSTGDGLSGAVTESPSIPTWLGQKIIKYMINEKSETRKFIKHMQSTRGVAIFLGDREDKQHWIKVGRSFERFALQATALGILTAHVNQPVEVTEIRAKFANWLGDSSKRPDLIIRFGYGNPLPMSLRRSLGEVIE